MFSIKVGDSHSKSMSFRRAAGYAVQVINNSHRFANALQAPIWNHGIEVLHDGFHVAEMTSGGKLYYNHEAITGLHVYPKVQYICTAMARAISECTQAYESRQ